jgi:23S rRNA pseudouridine2605 synthase
MSLVRLQKFIADAGITSRRKAEDLILAGRIKVNEVKVTKLGTKVDTEKDIVEYNGEVISSARVDHVYLLMNKPRGCVTTVSDPEGRKTVMDYVKINTRVFPVGRLDYLSEGLLLLTNDGDLANKIMHPRFEITKTYEVKVFGKVTPALLKKLKEGIHAHDGHLRPQSVRVIEVLPNKTWLEFRLNEGKNREIRRICEASGLVIDKLKRVAIGAVDVVGIKPGDWTYVHKVDLLKSLGIKKDGTKLETGMQYISPKKTVQLGKISTRIQKNAVVANDQKYKRYKKDEYYKTIEIHKEVQEKAKRLAMKQANENVDFKLSYEKKYRKNN